MGKKRRRHPHRHTGKLVPLRTADQIRAEIMQNVGVKPNLNKWRELAVTIADYERGLVESEADRRVMLDRTAVIAEFIAHLGWIQQRDLHDQNGNPRDLTHEEATELANRAIAAGYRLGQAASRSLEAEAADRLEQEGRGRYRSEQNRERGFSTTRDELLELCRKAYRRHPGCNQRALVEHVATGLPIGGERVRQLMREHEIRKPDYS